MKPLTDSLPKPLLKVANKSLIEHHIEKLAAAGISDIVINIAWLAEKVHELLGDGTKYGVKITYSHEKQGALENGGWYRDSNAVFRRRRSISCRKWRCLY